MQNSVANVCKGAGAPVRSRSFELFAFVAARSLRSVVAKVAYPNRQQPLVLCTTQVDDLRIGADTETCFKVGVKRRPVACADCEQR
jgi:hypothetical protein